MANPPEGFTDEDVVEVGNLIADCVGWVSYERAAAMARFILGSQWFVDYRRRVAAELASLGVIRIESAPLDPPRPANRYTGD